MNIYSLYTYHIAWTSLDKHYYGVRYAKNCNPVDLWSSYFTSSKLVKQYREQYGEPDIVEVRKTFECPHKAKLWERKVLQRLNVLHNDKWINANIGGDQFIISKHSEETKKKMSLNNGSRRPEVRKAISTRQSGKQNSFYGKRHSDEARRLKSEKNKGYFWWTVGQDDVKSKVCPSGFRRGKSAINKDSRGRFIKS
jgi:hypothetical protein